MASQDKKPGNGLASRMVVLKSLLTLKSSMEEELGTNRYLDLGASIKRINKKNEIRKSIRDFSSWGALGGSVDSERRTTQSEGGDATKGAASQQQEKRRSRASRPHVSPCCKRNRVVGWQ